MLRVAISDRQARLKVDKKRLREAVRNVLSDAGYEQGEISVAIVDDPTIHELNRKYLNHDYPTDVLSFLLSDEGDESIEGEVIVSADTAANMAEQYSWSADDELLLYVIHGTLHIAGYDDLEPELQQAMREQERIQLARFNLSPRY